MTNRATGLAMIFLALVGCAEDGACESFVFAEGSAFATSSAPNAAPWCSADARVVREGYSRQLSEESCDLAVSVGGGRLSVDNGAGYCNVRTFFEGGTETVGGVDIRRWREIWQCHDEASRLPILGCDYSGVIAAESLMFSQSPE